MMTYNPANQLMSPDTTSLARAVQHNCHIADSRHAGDYTLCVYLLKMREYYRWEKRLPLSATLAKEAVGSWLTKRERLWESLDEADYQPLLINGEQYSPFDTDLINSHLRESALVYSGGLGQHCRPHFFLAQLGRWEQHGDMNIYVSERELARDLTAPPAMALGQNIFIRRESLRRMLWEKVEEWRWHKKDGAMQRALAFYNFDQDAEAALDAMTDNEVDSVLWHEIGEIKAGELLDQSWHDMLMALPRSGAEIMARAVRDLLADCVSTLPALLEQERHASLHFYFGNLRAMRKELFPGLTEAYQHWLDYDDLDCVEKMANVGRHHWRDVAEHMLGLYQQHGEDCRPHLEKLVGEIRL